MIQKLISIDRIKLFLILLIVISIPLFFKFFFHAAIPVYVILLMTISKFVLEEISHLNIQPVIRKTIKIISKTGSLLFAVVLLVAIIITPVSVYEFFFKQAASNLKESYYVANLFVLLITLFSLFFCSYSLKQKSVMPLIGLAGLVCGLLLIIYQTIYFLIFLIISVLLYIILILNKKAVYLILLITACIIISLILFGFWSHPKGSKVVDTFLFPEMRQFISSNFPQFPLLIDIPGYGYHHRTDRLGGRAFLTSSPVLEVETNKKETIYLRTNSYDIYTGTSWKSTVNLLQNPEPVSEEDVFFKNSGFETLKIKILTDIFPLVPFTIDTYGFLYDNNYYDINGIDRFSGIEMGDGLKKNSIITLYRKKTEKRENGNLQNFLQVPENLPESVIRLASLLRQNISSKNEVLKNIERFLLYEYSYNLQIPDLKKDEDFLENFLFKEKQGYCTHFATAFAVLARLNNIPARYVTGYLVYCEDGKNKKTVTAKAAHAWPEIWLPETGWQIREPTHAVIIDNYNMSQGEMYYWYMYRYMINGNEIARNSLTLSQLHDLLGVDIQSSKEKEKFILQGINIIPVIIYFFVTLLIMSSIVSLTYIIIRVFQNRKPDRQLKKLLNRVVKSFKHIPLPEEKGWIHWKMKLCAIYSIEESKAESLLDIILKLVYSNQQVEKEELKSIKYLCKSIGQGAVIQTGK